MLNVISALELSSEFLYKKGVESPRLNAELLLAEILGCSRLELYLKFDQPLKDQEVSKYREFIKRRGEREPYQYIVGNTEFYGMKLKISPDVLIPRSETELLIERVIQFTENLEDINILDIGTGSGNIALGLRCNIKSGIIDSIDISERALSIARENSEKYNNSNAVNFYLSSIESFVTDKKYDAVVSNPPYISLQDYSSLEPELLKYEPRAALTDEADGFKYYSIIASKAGALLKKGGRLFFEMGFGQSERIGRIMKDNGFTDLVIKKDYQNIDRVIDGVFL
jgi:release factor glutamine methyltransferase